MCLSSNLSANARVASKLIDRALEIQAKVLFLPEAADYISRDADHSFQLAQKTHAEFVSVIRDKLRRCSNPSGLCVAVGIHEPSSRSSKVQNNLVWIDSRGDITHRYQKLHLFDINIPNGPILKELKSVEPGEAIVAPFQVSADSQFRVGLSICYDIRFPELATKLRKLGANIITYPSAFTTRTGQAHWVALGKARAIDSQCFVIMAAQCGQHDINADLGLQEQTPLKKPLRESFGQSLIIGPWGEILAQAKDYTERDYENTTDDYFEMVHADLDLDSLEKVRNNLPVFTHRREDLY